MNRSTCRGGAVRAWLPVAVWATLAGTMALAAGGGTISGAGATFPYPVYAKWADTYAKQEQVKLNYQAIGSGGGIKQITEGTVDFGASDAPLKPDELAKAGLVQFPVVMGAVVPVINVAGVKTGELKLGPDVLAAIFMGQIKKWNDPKIAADNASLKLPDTAISVVHRSDGSGTTWIFTLSGGQQQRLCIARAVAVKPEILLLDEPASALDPISTQKIEQLISELKAEYTIAVVTHNMQQAARVSDYSAFMYLGRLVEFGDTKTLFTHPTERQTEEYITGRFG